MLHSTGVADAEGISKHELRIRIAPNVTSKNQDNGEAVAKLLRRLDNNSYIILDQWKFGISDICVNESNFEDVFIMVGELTNEEVDTMIYQGDNKAKLGTGSSVCTKGETTESMRELAVVRRRLDEEEGKRAYVHQSKALLSFRFRAGFADWSGTLGLIVSPAITLITCAVVFALVKNVVMAILFFLWNFVMVVLVPACVSDDEDGYGFTGICSVLPREWAIEKVEMGGEDLFLNYKNMMLVPDFDGFFRQQECVNWTGAGDKMVRSHANQY